MKLIKLVTPVFALGMGWVLLSSDVRAQLPGGRVAHKGAISQAAAAMGISKAVRDLPTEPAKADSGEIEWENVRTIRNPRVRTENRAGRSDEWMDLAVQTIVPEPLMPSPILTFEGNSSADNFAAYGGRVLPPDTHGDVGPNHFVQQTNLLVRVFNKAGVPLTPPFKLSSLFTSGGICNVTDNGDPYVAYDPLADRWLLTQFGFTSPSAPPYHQCIAVSQTPDPTGAYFLYDFVTPGNEFPDYPKLAVWPDAYYMTVNQFAGGGPFDGAGAYAFDRQKMLAGDPTATFNYFNLNLASHPEGIGGLLASDLDGLVPPPAGSPAVFAYFVATEFGDPLDGLRLFDFHADFVTPGSATFTERAESPVAVAAFNPLFTGFRVPQPGGAPGLQLLNDRLMTRLQYRNTPSGQSLVVTHSVDADSSIAFKAGIRYYELLRGGATYSVAEQATFSPDAINRWMGSAATDHDGNLAVGYSVSSDTVFPGIRFAGRLATDPPGGLFQGESIAINGSGVQLHSTGRWGDYSALTLDPQDDCTFWYTQEYYTAAGQASSAAGWQTRVATFKFPTCSALQRGTINVHVTLCSTGADVANAAVRINGALYGVTKGAGTLTALVAPGTFTVAASSPAGSGSTSVTVGAGGTVAANVCLAGAVLPDLVEAAVSNPPATVAPGGSFSVTDTAQNSGAGPAAASTTRYYLSLDTTKSGGDVLLTGSRAVPVLAAGASSSGTATTTVPAATAPGTYFLLACADDTGTVPESNEGNNCIASATTVQVQGVGSGPDLVVTAVSNPPASATFGGTFSVTDTTMNQGDTPVMSTKTRYYLSLDTVRNAGDKLLTGTRKVPALAAGGSSTGTRIVTVKLSTKPGTYFLLACADDRFAVPESDETNNCRASTTQVIIH